MTGYCGVSGGAVGPVRGASRLPPARGRRTHPGAGSRETADARLIRTVCKQALGSPVCEQLQRSTVRETAGQSPALSRTRCAAALRSWWRYLDSNQGHLGYEPSALTPELYRRAKDRSSRGERCGAKTRTWDLRVMSPTSCHCSTPQADSNTDIRGGQSRSASPPLTVRSGEHASCSPRPRWSRACRPRQPTSQRWGSRSPGRRAPGQRPKPHHEPGPARCGRR